MAESSVNSLGTRLGGGLSDDLALEAVLEWVSELGLELYDAQEEALLELFAGRHVILATPTGSGKSLVAVGLHALFLARGQRSVYTAPIKALVSEKFFSLCRIFGAENVGMMTGDGSVNRDAPIVCCTAEVLQKIALRDDVDTPFEGVVMDEFHYYADRDRGMAWQVPLITMSRATFLLMSATLGDTSNIVSHVERRTGRSVAVVEGAQRPVPLEFRYVSVPLLQTLEQLVRGNQSPMYVVHFTQRSAAELAQGLLSVDLADKDHKKRIKAEVAGVRFDSPYGKHLRRMVLHGVGLHHAGLLPRYRLLVERLAQLGLLKVICGTDTLGVGINVPIRCVLFTQLCKFDGERVGILTVRDFQQIGGRAGRKGFDDQGLVVVQAPAWVVENKRVAGLVAQGKKKKPKVKAQAPTRGYKHWDESTFDRLVGGRAEALKPTFSVDHSVVLARLRRAADLDTDPLEEIDALIAHAHVGQREAERLRTEARKRLDELVRAGVAEPVKTAGGTRYDVYEDLQDDFSVYHELSLFLLHLVGQLDPSAPDYALDVLSCVECILEHPKVVLYAQVQRAKGNMIAELKAAGVPYEERLEAIEDVTWPKPKADWFYGVFETFRERRPWLAGEPVRPKAIVREMVEAQAVFSTYVKDLGIDRSEGVLLRYVSTVYKTLLQGVPSAARTDDVAEVLGYLRALLARVDDSLLKSWEALAAGETDRVEVARPVDISAELKTFRARIRAELHAVVRALAIGDCQEAAASGRTGEHSLDAGDLEQGLAQFQDELGPLAWDGRAKAGWNSRIASDGPHRWRVSQRLLPADLDVDPDEVAWSIDGVVDLRDDTNPSGPIVTLLAIGE